MRETLLFFGRKSSPGNAEGKHVRIGMRRGVSSPDQTKRERERETAKANKHVINKKRKEKGRPVCRNAGFQTIKKQILERFSFFFFSCKTGERGRKGKRKGNV